MPQVSSLSEKLALDPDNRPAIEQQKTKIENETEEMQEKINEFIKAQTELQSN